MQTKEIVLLCRFILSGSACKSSFRECSRAETHYERISRLRGTIYFLMSAEFAVACIIQEHLFRDIGCRETADGIKGSKLVRRENNDERFLRARSRESENTVFPAARKITKTFKQSVRSQRTGGGVGGKGDLRE